MAGASGRRRPKRAQHFFFANRLYLCFIKRTGRIKSYTTSTFLLFHIRWQDTSVRDEQRNVDKLEPESSDYNTIHSKDYTALKIATVGTTRLP